MKKIIVGILVCMLLIGSVLASANIVENEVELKDEKTSFFEIEDGEISTIIPVESYEIESTEQGDEISVENFGRLLVPGKPNLPSKIFSIAIPPGSEVVDVSFEVSDSIVLAGSYEVQPVSLPRVICGENPVVYEQEQKTYEENYNSVYGNDDPYPSSVVEFVQTSGYRKYNLVDVRVNPFTYYPLSGQLIYYPEISIHVSYTFPEGFSYDEIMVDNIPRAEQLAKKIIYNYDEASRWYPTGVGGRETYDYVIITLDSLTSKVTSLVDWEVAKGRSVYVATTDWINSNYNGYDLAEKMRNFLRDKYPSEKWGILDICLIGHYDDVPMRRCWQDVGHGKPETDYYYAELSLPDDQSWDADGDHRWGENSDPIDFYAEVNIGRIPWSDTDTVEHICDKTVAYEQTSDPAFKKNILLLGAFLWDNDPNPRTDNAVLMEYKVNPSLHPWMSDWSMTRMYEMGHSTYPMDYDLTHTNVVNVWSSGSFAFVDWAGHGSPTACYRYHPSTPFVDTATCNYLNDDYPAIIFADACSNSDTDYLNIGQAMMKQGAIGFLGATKVAYGMPGWDHPNDGSSQSFDYYFTTCCTSGDYTQGEAHQWSLLEMYTLGLWYQVKYEMFEWGALWGNPDLAMAPLNLPPETPSKPSGPTQGVEHEELTFSTSTTDPEEDQIYYKFDWGNGEFSSWLGPHNSGQTIQASYHWDEKGTYEIKAKAKDVNDRESDWSEPHIVTILENMPPDAPTASCPTIGQVGKPFKITLVSTDPEGHDVSYYISWGDGTDNGWEGLYPSGEEVTFTHTYTQAGSLTIITKAKDAYGKKSGQTNVKIYILKNRAVTNPVILQFLEFLKDSLPLLERLLNL